MSDLQIMLIVIGALIILAVIIVNWWQERRFHQQIERSFSPLESDALLDEPKIDESKIDASKFDGDNFDNSKFDNANFDNPDFDDTTADDFAFTVKQAAHTFDDEIDKLKDRGLVNSVAKVDDTEHFVAHAKHDFLAEKPTENLSIGAEFTKRSNQIFSDLSKDQPILNVDRHLATGLLNSASEIKLSHHDDIKAIFNDAFSQSAKMASVNECAVPDERFAAQVSPVDLKPEKTVFGTQPDNNEQQISAEILELSLPAMLNSQIDLTAVLYLASETSVSVLNNILLGLLENFDKPVFVNVLISQSESNKQWILLSEAFNRPKYSQLRVSRVAFSLQLADRAGPVTRNVLNRFQLAAETFGLDINAHIEWQSTGDILAAATALDTFCLDVDKTIGFHLIHGENGAFTGTKLRGLAEAQGFMLDSNGTFKYLITPEKLAEKPSENHGKTPFLFTMFNRDNHPFSLEMLRSSVVKGITFQLDIPHITQSSEAFTQMVQVANQMETGLNAVLVDDNNKVLSDIQINRIRHQLKVIHATMLARGIIPGSDCALRLFS